MNLLLLYIMSTFTDMDYNSRELLIKNSNQIVVQIKGFPEYIFLNFHGFSQKSTKLYTQKYCERKNVTISNILVKNKRTWNLSV
jgi:hypothetical protein